MITIWYQILLSNGLFSVTSVVLIVDCHKNLKFFPENIKLKEFVKDKLVKKEVVVVLVVVRVVLDEVELVITVVILVLVLVVKKFVVAVLNAEVVLNAVLEVEVGKSIVVPLAVVVVVKGFDTKTFAFIDEFKLYG